jgi:hypothetical protein
VKNRHYRSVLAVITLLAGAALASPGCDAAADTCPGVAGKLCDKACACGSKCSFIVGGTPVVTQSKFLCVPEYTGQCTNQTGIDFAACSDALDNAQCNKELEALQLPTECTSMATTTDGGLGGGSASSSASGGGAGN